MNELNIRYLNKPVINNHEFKFQSLIKVLISDYNKYKDPHTFLQIYELTFSYVYDVVYDMTGSESSSVYIVQKTYQTLSTEFSTFDNTGNLNTWLRDKAMDELLIAGYQLSLFPNYSSKAV